METERLYLSDPLLETFDARVVAHAELGGRPALVLDRSAFYPESGGQQADRGRLAGLEVLDVQKDEAGRVLHLLDGDLPAVGEQVEGRIHMARRRQHMAQHTGQHLLSAAMLELADARTLSSHLGAKACTLDVDRGDLSGESLSACEALVNRVIDEDRAVKGWWPTSEELAGLTLRRSPKVVEAIRVVSIADLDHTPCGGTHCTRTSQVGLLLLLSAEHYKGGTRITFVTGARARDLARQERDALKDAANRLDCRPEQTPARIAKLAELLNAARERNKRLSGRLAEEIAQRLMSAAKEDVLMAHLDDVGADLLLPVGQRIVTQPERVALLVAPEGEWLKLLAIRGSDSDFDCGAFIRRLCESAGGKGGGRPGHAQGVLPPMDGETWRALVREHWSSEGGDA